MKTEPQLRAYVMRRVYLMYYGRAISRPLPRLALLVGLALVFVGSVSVVNVVANALSTDGLYGFANFVIDAFVTTTPLVQLVSVGIAAMLAWFVVDTAKNIELVAAPTARVPVQ